MRSTIRPGRRHHSMPTGIYEFVSTLEAFDGVEAVNSGRFIRRPAIRGFRADVQFYDEARRTFRLRVANSGFISYPEIRVASHAKGQIEDYIRGYAAKPKLMVTLEKLKGGNDNK